MNIKDKYIIRPNKFYDKIKEPYRLFLLLFSYISLVLITGFKIGFFLFCLVGLWRIYYCMVEGK